MSGVAMEDMRIFERAVTSPMTVCMAGERLSRKHRDPKLLPRVTL